MTEHKLPDTKDSRTDHECTQTGEADVGDEKSAVSGDMNEAGDAGSEKSGAVQEACNPENENQRGWLPDLIVSAHFAADERAAIAPKMRNRAIFWVTRRKPSDTRTPLA